MTFATACAPSARHRRLRSAPSSPSPWRLARRRRFSASCTGSCSSSCRIATPNSCSGSGPISPAAIGRRSTCRISSTIGIPHEPCRGWPGSSRHSANLSDEGGGRARTRAFEPPEISSRSWERTRGSAACCSPSDERPGAEPVVVLAEPFWKRRFGGDPAIVGRAIRLNGEEYTVVGVLAAGFAMPVRDIEFVLPFAADQDPRRGARNSVNFIIGVGRLAEQVSLVAGGERAERDRPATAGAIPRREREKARRSHGRRDRRHRRPVSDGPAGRCLRRSEPCCSSPARISRI